MSSGLDRPSERNIAIDPKADTRVGTAARAPVRAPQRVIIRTAENRFDIPLDEIPSGMSYEWKVKTVYGKEACEQMLAWKLNGWTPVPAGRHPGFTGESTDSQAEIERGGQILCERPLEVTEMVRDMDRERAREQVQAQMDRLNGRAKETGSQRVTKIDRGYVPINDKEY